MVWGGGKGGGRLAVGSRQRCTQLTLELEVFTRALACNMKTNKKTLTESEQKWGHVFPSLSNSVAGLQPLSSHLLSTGSMFHRSWAPAYGKGLIQPVPVTYVGHLVRHDRASLISIPLPLKVSWQWKFWSNQNQFKYILEFSQPIPDPNIYDQPSSI